MSDEAWAAGYVKCLGVRLAGDLIDEVDEKGERLVGDTLLLLLNAHHEPIPFALPATRPEHSWERLLDTADSTSDPIEQGPGRQYTLQGRSLAVLRTRPVEETEPPASSLEVEALRKEALPPAPPRKSATFA
jgi:glycogen operon protein